MNILCPLLLLVISVDRSEAKKNVLFLIIDDLRPELASYYSAGSQLYGNMHTPNIDALAARSLLIKHAYVQKAICGPSRASFMTSRRPDTTHVYNLVDYWRIVGGPFETIPEHFKLNGYRTAGMGKIYHPGSASGDDNDAQSWTEPYFRGTKVFENNRKSWRAIKEEDLTNNTLRDEQVANHAISTLQNLANGTLNGSEHFFVAVGFFKPHLPFVYPKRIMTTYYPSAGISLPSNPYAPKDMPSVAWSDWSQLRGYKDIEALNVSGAINETLPDAKVKDLRRAYYSAVTWIDEQLGRVVNEITNLGLENSTIISLVSDHGFLLGEHAEWCKHTVFELATHAPMMIHIPGVTDSGIVTEELVEFVDLFPTIVEAAGLTPLALCPDNSSTITNCTEGVSLIPLINNPSNPIRNATFSQQKRGPRMGYSLRTKDYRYTEWVGFDSDTYAIDWTELFGTELYNLTSDLEENVNVAGDSAYQSTVTLLSDALHKGWRHSLI